MHNAYLWDTLESQTTTLLSFMTIAFDFPFCRSTENENTKMLTLSALIILNQLISYYKKT